MLDYIDIGSSPCEEDGVSVDPKKDYLPAMREECNRFIAAIRKKLGPEPEGARLAIRSNPHDFGTYLEVVCYYHDQDEESQAYAFRCEAHAPRTWDDDKPVPPEPKPEPGQEYLECTICNTKAWKPEVVAIAKEGAEQWQADHRHFMGEDVEGIRSCVDDGCFGYMVLKTMPAAEEPDPASAPAAPVEVCDSCLAVAYDNLREADRATAVQAMMMMGLDVEDHLCDARESPSLGINCHCACNQRRAERAERTAA